MNHLGRTIALAAGMLWLLAACGTPAAAPETTAVPVAAAGTPTAAPEPPATPTAAPIALPTAAPLQAEPPTAQTNNAGNVVVTVTPEVLSAGAPLAFEISMNTHSVDLAGDMLALVELRDERGSVRKPTVWDGPVGGGHHRAGVIRFDALPAGTRSITLVVKNIAGIRERAFTWELAS